MSRNTIGPLSAGAMMLAGYIFTLTAPPALANPLRWIRQLGGPGDDQSQGVSADGLGNVYITGTTAGSLGGLNAGGVDAFIGKYNAAGNLLWTRQLGTTAGDGSFGVSADALGNVYISGQTGGNLGGPSAGSDDAFVSKYDAAGILQWTRQLGTLSADYAWGVSADGLGGVYMAGYTLDGLGGSTAGGSNAFLAKYDSDGTPQWTRQFGTDGEDSSFGVSADGLGNVYISGSIFRSLGEPDAGDLDAFVSKYDSDGTLQWMQQFGTSEEDASLSVSADGFGNVYVSGYTFGNLGAPHAGDHDAFISKYDSEGTLQWTKQFGTVEYDLSSGVSADGLGRAFLTGFTRGSLGGPHAGGYDAFIAVVPEPAGWLLALIAVAVVSQIRNLTSYS